ncbi:hypothetical protein [Novosphingobium sediminicola]|uniref:Uncharacterized protein n=1 Tax=Novosphingobium sediminicola TaxID=563162 RepID=A0A7W6CCS0_9SPHN|nr:hypothetical protein [Novosphingobium sediminicola]MBB3953447.1 hypothetical protein [Novosphingobium sediminicola]
MPTQSLESHHPRNLLQWRPAHLLLVLFLLAGGTAAWRIMAARQHFVEGSVHVETEGTRGAITGGELVLDLPVTVYNGTESAIVTVNTWTEAFACPEEDSPQSECTRLHSSEQSIDMHVQPGSSGSESRQIRTGLPRTMAGDYVRVKRRLTGVTSDVEQAEQRQTGP